MAHDDDTFELENEVRIYELIHALVGYTQRLEKSIVKLRIETNHLAGKAGFPIPYSDLHTDIYETFDDFPAFTKYKELFSCDDQ